jgi:predicted class III extradiol MEMO1 family dioxygenase
MGLTPPLPLLLPRLRADLDILPSPLAERPGLLLRDPFRLADSALIIPPPLVRALGCFDGLHDRLDLRNVVAGLTDRPAEVDGLVDALVNTLSTAGFLDDDEFRRLRADRLERFSRETVRVAAFAGGGYPPEEDALTRLLDGWLRGDDGERVPREGGAAKRVGIAAPHASPSEGVATYRAAYRALDEAPDDCTFVILGTSHYGAADRFGLTRKAFRTPLGEATTDVPLVDALVKAAPGAVELEDYCHAVEHSIEFQVLFLQKLYGPKVRILPILCGPFSGGQGAVEQARAGAAADGGSGVPLPERVAAVEDAIGALAALQNREGERLRWILGVDMAHVGPRYGDARVARAGQGEMNEVAARDRARLDRIAAGDATGFWELTHARGADDLKWCGSSPLYTFLRVVPRVRGRVLHYDQWNIDDSSVVSFAALEFVR